MGGFSCAPPSTAFLTFRSMDAFVDEEGEAALAELEEELDEERSVEDALAAMAQRGARSAPEPPTAGNAAATAEPQPTARTPAAGSPGTSGACVDCSSGRAQPKFREAFGLSVCYDCQRAGRGEGGRYQVLSKSRAKDEYLLSDRQLDGERGGLRSMRLPNPNDARYGDMRLYLRRQARPGRGLDSPCRLGERRSHPTPTERLPRPALVWGAWEGEVAPPRRAPPPRPPPAPPHRTLRPARLTRWRSWRSRRGGRARRCCWRRSGGLTSGSAAPRPSASSRAARLRSR